MMQDPWWSRDPVAKPAQPQAAQTPFWANDPVAQDPTPRQQQRPQTRATSPQPAQAAPPSKIAAPTVSGLSIDESVQALMQQGYSAPDALRLSQEQQQRDKLGSDAANPIPLDRVDRDKLLSQNPTGAWVVQPGGEPYFVEPGSIEEGALRPGDIEFQRGQIAVRPQVDETTEQRRDMDPFARNVDAMFRGGVDAATLGFSDEIGSGLAAALSAARGQEGFGEGFERRQARERAINEADAQDAGGFRLTGQLLGGLVAPGTGAAGRFIQGAQGASRIARAGQVGAGYGAAYGLGGAEGNVAERAPEAVMGGLLGAGTGAIGQGALNAGGAGLRALGARNAQRAAERTPEGRVRGVLARALERDTITPQDYLASLDDAVPGQFPFERGGENLVGLAEVAAQSPGPARAELVKALRDRSDTATNRISERLGEAFGAEGNSIQTIRNRVKERGDAAAAGMAQFGDRPVALDDNAILALRQSLASKAVREEAINAAAELTPEGSAAANRLFSLTDEALDNPAAARMTIREAQDVSYALKEAASRAYRGGFNTRGAALQRASDAIRGAARQDGDYAAWLGDFGDASEVIDALRKGRNVFAGATEKNAMSSAELRDAWPTLSEGARENFRLGVGEALLDRARSQGGVTAMRRLLKDREIADRVRVAFGSDDAFESFMRGAADEVGMQDVANQVLGGSPTARRAAGAADLNAQEGSPVLDTIGMLAGDVSSGTALARRGVREVLARIPRKDRSVLGDRETNALLAQALRDPDFVRQILADQPGVTTQDASRLARALADRPRGSTAGQSAAALAQLLGQNPTQENRRAQQ